MAHIAKDEAVGSSEKQFGSGKAMALTREQALQLIQKSQSSESAFYASEIRVLSLEPGALPEFYRFHDEQISLQADCWVCEYEHRQRLPDGTSLGPWSVWKKRRGYVVVPESNPFFIVEEVRHV